MEVGPHRPVSVVEVQRKVSTLGIAWFNRTAEPLKRLARPV